MISLLRRSPIPRLKAAAVPAVYHISAYIRRIGLPSIGLIRSWQWHG
jgi:hypothetical protein